MTHSFWIKLLLLIAGLVGAGVGFSILFMPVGFHASAGITLGDNHSLMSEVRAPGAVLLVAGLFISAAAFVRRWQGAALWLSATLYGSYGLARLYSVAVDGVPHDTLLAALALELVIGGLAGLAIVRTRAVA